VKYQNQIKNSLKVTWFRVISSKVYNDQQLESFKDQHKDWMFGDKSIEKHELEWDILLNLIKIYMSDELKRLCGHVNGVESIDNILTASKVALFQSDKYTISDVAFTQFSFNLFKNFECYNLKEFGTSVGLICLVFKHMKLLSMTDLVLVGGIDFLVNNDLLDHKELTHISLGHDMTIKPEYMFKNNKLLEKVFMSPFLHTIKIQPFKNLENLTQCYLPPTI
jgi:hypothetical protein